MTDEYDWDAAWTKPDPPPARVNGTHPPRTDVHGYADRALDLEVAAVTNAPEGTRNATLNTAAFNLTQLVAAGHLNQPDVDTALWAAARTAGLDDPEIRATIASGTRGGMKSPRTIPEPSTGLYVHACPSKHTWPTTPRPWLLGAVPPVTILDELDDPDTFWTRRPILEHIRTYARARVTSPHAVLGVVLARTACTIPPFVVLPPTIGGAASLNIFVGLVGPSGAGKGAATAVAAEAVDVGPITSRGIGSGEGLLHVFVKRTKDGIDQHTTAALITVHEIDTLTAQADRRGSTTTPTLRSAWSGEQLGSAYADPVKNLLLPEHKYRMCLVAGIQPARATALLNDIDSGTPQRFLWMPATDPHAPETPPDCPDPIRWHVPGPWPHADTLTGRVTIPICDTAHNTIREAQRARNLGHADALDGHALLSRLKVAAILGIIDQRHGVNDEDWDLAGQVMAFSDHTRRHVQAILADKNRASNDARGEAEASRTVMVQERVEEAAIKRVVVAMRKHLNRAKDDGVTGGELRRALAGRDRALAEIAIERLLDAGLVTVEEATGGGTTGHRYRPVEAPE